MGVEAGQQVCTTLQTAWVAFSEQEGTTEGAGNRQHKSSLGRKSTGTEGWEAKVGIGRIQRQNALARMKIQGGSGNQASEAMRQCSGIGCWKHSRGAIPVHCAQVPHL